MRVGYGRVCTRDQNLGGQRDALQAARQGIAGIVPDCVWKGALPDAAARVAVPTELARRPRAWGGARR